MEKKFTALINTHKGILFKVCNLYFQDEEDKKDLFQEIVLQLWKSYPRFREESLVTTWMYRVALNTAISYFRKESKRPGNRPVSSLDYQLPNINAIAAHNEKMTALHLAIGQLTRIEKAVVILYLEEKKYEEISTIIGISLSNVGVMLNRIKTKLEKIIKTNHYAS